jgi:hypothetical protein
LLALLHRLRFGGVDLGGKMGGVIGNPQVSDALASAVRSARKYGSVWRFG